MAALSEYKVLIGGLEHTLLYSEEEAEKLGLTKAKAKAAPVNKARTVENK